MLGAIVKVALPPLFTNCCVPGVIVPPAPAVGVITKVCVKVAAMVWSAVTLLKV